jgi:uncharacterized protein
MNARERSMAMETIRTDHTEALVSLQPIAAPSILGLYGFAGATFIVAAHMANWYGDARSTLYLFPFAALFGGLAQFLAGMWAYRARDGLATAMHGMWGAFWLAFGLLYLLFATGRLAEPQGAFPELGYWFIVLAAITWVGTWAALATNWALVAVLAFLAAGSTCAAVAFLLGSTGWEQVAGWLFIISAICAWYTASALMLEGSYGHAILPVFKTQPAMQAPRFAVGLGEPGVMHGQ